MLTPLTCCSVMVWSLLTSCFFRQDIRLFAAAVLSWLCSSSQERDAYACCCAT